MAPGTRPIDLDSPDMPYALALATVAAAFAKTLRELTQDEDALVAIQRNLVVAAGPLRETPMNERALQMVYFVRDSLRNPNVIDQPDD